MAHAAPIVHAVARKADPAGGRRRCLRRRILPCPRHRGRDQPLRRLGRLTTGIGHNIGSHAPIRTQNPISRALSWMWGGKKLRNLARNGQKMMSKLPYPEPLLCGRDEPGHVLDVGNLTTKSATRSDCKHQPNQHPSDCKHQPNQHSACMGH